MEEVPPLTNGAMEEVPTGSHSSGAGLVPSLRIRDPDRPRESQVLSTASGSTAVSFSDNTLEPGRQDTTNPAGPDLTTDAVTDANLNHHLDAQATATAVAATVDLITNSDHVHARVPVTGRSGSWSASGLTTLVVGSVENDEYSEDEWR